MLVCKTIFIPRILCHSLEMRCALLLFSGSRHRSLRINSDYDVRARLRDKLIRHIHIALCSSCFSPCLTNTAQICKHMAKHKVEKPCLLIYTWIPLIFQRRKKKTNTKLKAKKKFCIICYNSEMVPCYYSN